MLKTNQVARTRRGFTLIEMLVSVVILGAMGIAFTKFLTMQNRFFERETNAKSARSIARNSMALLMSDLRMLQDNSSIDLASSDGDMLRVFVPYRYGLYCGTNGLKSTVSMLPADSATVAMAAYDGYAWRDPVAGTYTVVANSAVPVTSSAPATCTGTGAGQAQLRTVSVNGRAGDILDIPLIVGVPVAGTPVFFWQKITYSFKPSVIFPGLNALWRKQEGGRNDELLGPFDANARFRYYIAGDDTSRTVVPTDLTTIRGIDVVLSANSPRISAGRTHEKATARDFSVLQERPDFLITKERPMSRFSLSNRDGFALPMAIVAIVILTAGLAAGFAATAAEYTNNASVRGQSRAYNLAESGLEAFMVRRSDSTFCAVCAHDDPTTADSEYTTVPYPPYGYANVVAVRVRAELNATTPAIYFIRSTGVDTTPRLGHALNVNATRTVGMYAQWSTNTVKVMASWLSFPGLVKKGSAGTISGVDQCGQKPTVAGIMVPKVATLRAETSPHGHPAAGYLQDLCPAQGGDAG